MDFIILKINGQDLSAATHNDILTAFKTASEPILVEVARRNPKSTKQKPTINHQNNTMTDLSIAIPNGDLDIANSYATTLIYDHPPPMSLSTQSIANDHNRSLSPSSHLLNCNPTNNCVDPTVNGVVLEYEEHYEDDDEDQVEIIKEEVILRKMDAREIFGLTLSYSALAANDNSESEVYISAIESDSVASKQQGIKIGDQILQINNIDVHSKAQVVSLFRSCCLEVRMLLGRPSIFSKKKGLTSGKNHLFNCDLAAVEEAEYSSVYDDVGSCKDRDVCPPQLDKDSGIGGRGIDETAKTGDSSECDSTQASLLKSSQFSSMDSCQARVDIEQISLLMHHLATEYNQLQRLLQRPASDSASPRIQALPPPTLGNTSSRVVPRMGTKLDPPQLKMCNGMTPAASGSNTSAYSTGIDSTRSSPLTMELGPSLTCSSLLSLKLDHIVPSNGRNLHDEDIGIPPSSSRSKLTCYATSSSASMTELPEPRVSTTSIQDNECHYYDVYDPATTNTSNDPNYESISQSVYQSPYIMSMEHEYINLAMAKSDRNHSKMEWVVKKRPDGTRYITRRPIRDKILKDRAKKVIEERSGLTTEDEEYGSDAKMLKYLCKTEKRRTQEKSKEKKHKRREGNSTLQSDIALSTNSPALSRSDMHSMSRSHLRAAVADQRNVDLQQHKLYNRATFAVGSTMF